MTVYDRDFFAGIRDSTDNSARIIVAELLRHFRIHSVIDIGCGEGVWLRAFLDRDVNQVVGLDGPYVQRERLQIPAAAFRPTDLRVPIGEQTRFDLAICLEVAEHLPQERGPSLVADLARLSDLVLFSAAKPFQGGTGHINEQWQDYWRDLFAAHGHLPCDLIRTTVWGDERVAWYYQQNMILYGTSKALADAGLRPSAAKTLNIASKRLVEGIPKASDLYFSELVRRLPGAFVAAALKRFRGFMKPTP